MIALIIALLTFLTAKANGSSNTQAALIGAGAGLATHYVTTQTKWGRENLQPINNSLGKFFGISGGSISGSVVTDSDGNVVEGPEGHTPVKQPDGSIIWMPNSDSNGGFWSGTSDVLKSWGATGTATVIGTSNLTKNGLNTPLIIGGGLIALLLLRK